MKRSKRAMAAGQRNRDRSQWADEEENSLAQWFNLYDLIPRNCCGLFTMDYLNIAAQYFPPEGRSF